jgi:transposase
MDASESALNREDMERRRLAAAQQLLGGQTQAKVARMYGVSRTTASRWHRSLSATGVDALRKRRATGRPSRLTPEQLTDVARIYREGPLLHGFTADRWTTNRFALVIEARFGVHYDEDHVGRLMHKLGLRSRRDAFYNPAMYAPVEAQAAVITP